MSWRWKHSITKTKFIERCQWIHLILAQHCIIMNFLVISASLTCPSCHKNIVYNISDEIRPTMDLLTTLATTMVEQTLQESELSSRMYQQSSIRITHRQYHSTKKPLTSHWLMPRHRVGLWCIIYFGSGSGTYVMENILVQIVHLVVCDSMFEVIPWHLSLKPTTTLWDFGAMKSGTRGIRFDDLR